MVPYTKSNIGGCVHLSIHRSYLRDIGSIGLNARNVNLKSRRTKIRLILPFHVSTRCMDEESCITLILNQNHWIFGGRAYRIHVERIAHIQSVAIDSVRSGKSGRSCIAIKRSIETHHIGHILLALNRELLANPHLHVAYIVATLERSAYSLYLLTL